MELIEARIQALLIADRPNSFVSRRIDELTLDFGGIPGDRHYGTTKPAGVREKVFPKGVEIRNRRQLSLLSVEECATVAGEMGLDELLPEWLGANLLLQGIADLTHLPAGSRLFFPSGAGLVCEGLNRPCQHPGRVIQDQFPEREGLVDQFIQVAKERRGIVATVERPGPIRAGDTVRILL